MKVLPVESPLLESASVGAAVSFGPVLDAPPLLPLVEVPELVLVTVAELFVLAVEPWPVELAASSGVGPQASSAARSKRARPVRQDPDMRISMAAAREEGAAESAASTGEGWDEDRRDDDAAISAGAPAKDACSTTRAGGCGRRTRSDWSRHHGAPWCRHGQAGSHSTCSLQMGSTAIRN